MTTSLENKPGTLAEATGKLAKAGINIEAAMPVGMAGDKVSLAFATDQPAKAREVLSSLNAPGSLRLTSRRPAPTGDRSPAL